MGLSLFAYLILAITGVTMFSIRHSGYSRPSWLQPLHYATGASMVGLVLLLLAVGIVGTLGHYGSLGHSGHLSAGLTTVALVFLSAASGSQITKERPWVRWVHIGTNIALFVVFAWVLLTGWLVVQKYLP
jgi:cytochrome b561